MYLGQEKVDYLTCESRSLQMQKWDSKCESQQQPTANTGLGTVVTQDRTHTGEQQDVIRNSQNYIQLLVRKQKLDIIIVYNSHRYIR